MTVASTPAFVSEHGFDRRFEAIEEAADTRLPTQRNFSASATKAPICGPIYPALRHCIATAVEVQWHAPGWVCGATPTRDILDPDQRPSSLSSTPGTACSPLSITKWSHIKR
jgi:hypothetical protein